ncbi:DNA breaking-rejoining protein [Sporosarcina sp. P18a]|uniref:DUF2190 family protein n=1 Tax=Sporosarcina sp. P18a TaxID=2048259 RepID=UPI000C1635FE|nr:DUF2190 family protein [Sporosarcina sp. P18a]PIC80536.1 DNA breaking-rejoining protein [Sporosarcina sp. P18a]
MVQAIYVQRGETIDFTNGTETDITAGEVITLDTRIGIAATSISVGTKGALNVVGVYDFPALTTEALTVGQPVYFTDGKVVATETGTVLAGWVVEPKTQAGAVARVKID